MSNLSTIPYRVQSDLALAALAKLTQGNQSQAVELGKFLQTLPTHMSEFLSERIMQYDVNTDLKGLVNSNTLEDRFRIHTAAEALLPQPPIEWIVERLFAKGTVSMIVGNPGCKKTYSMIDLGICAAMGDRWLDFSTSRSSVLLVDEESGVRRINERLGDAMRGHGADGTIPLNYISMARFNLRSASDGKTPSVDLSMLEEKIQETKAELVIIDALADVMPGADENSVKDVQPVFMSLRQVADNTQCAIIIIHHANRSGDYRGSSAILGALDVMLTVQSKAGSPNVDFEVTKHRDGEPMNFSAVANFGDGSFSLTASQFMKQNQFSASHTFVLGYLIKNGESLLQDITSHADVCSEQTARKAVYALARSGLIIRTDLGGPGAKAVYGLSDRGKEKMAYVM